MFGVSLSPPYAPRCPKPVSSSRITSTFGASGGAVGRFGQSSTDSSYVFAILPLKPAMRGSVAGSLLPTTSVAP
jgi:hypothetical protein